jgi:DNA-binding CsgD family transcriptional regulator
LHLFQLCAEALRERAAGKRLVLGVDDAHLLDPMSAALVLHVAMNATAFVVVTVRAGERCPDPIVALWKDLEVPRLELQPLSEEEVALLLERALGGEVAPGVLGWAYRASEGHPLYLRELVKGALASGALTNQAGRWRLSAQPALSPALAELISEGLDGLGADELAAARVLALGEPLELDTVARITGLAPLAGLEARGLALVAPAGPGQARLSHPLYGEVVRAAMPHAGAVELRMRLAEAVRASGLGRRGDALRVAVWLEDAGATPDGPLLLAAAGDANALGDPELAERLARGAPNGPERALVLGRALVLQRRFAEAETVLAACEGRFDSPEPAVVYLEHRALRVLHVGLQRSGAALALLDRAESWFAQRVWSGRVDLIRSQVLLTSPGAGSARAVDALDRLLRQDDLIPELRRRASIAYALSLFEVGRTVESRVLTERLRPRAVPLRGDDDAYALVAWWAVRLMAGYEWDEVERWLGAADRSTAGSDDPLTRGEVVTMLAGSAMCRGRPATAKRRAREAIDVLERSDAMGRLPLAWLCLALSSAMQGDRSDTRAALAGYDVAVGAAPVPYLQAFEITARAQLAVLDGAARHAAAMLLDAASNDEVDPVDRAAMLHEALRVGAPARTVAPQLEALAGVCDAPLVALFAQLAGAVAADDAAALMANAEALGELGAWLWASESGALAALAYAKSGRDDSARRAIGLSARFRAECEGVVSPVLAAVELAPAELTRREREIVMLAATGASNAEIAGRLVLSVRTVESHLYRAMRKLGVSTRQDLRAHQSH